MKAKVEQNESHLTLISILFFQNHREGSFSALSSAIDDYYVALPEYCSTHVLSSSLGK